jgi:cytosine/adenosine deaminase-related metal-dependent hydrolase
MAWTVIRHGRVLDVGARRADAADVLLEGHTIREVGPPGLAAPAEARVVDARDRLLMPGLVNAHTHSHGALSKGLVPGRARLETYLVSASALSSHRDPQDKYLSALLSAMELVRKGCTAAYDLFVEYPLPSVDGVHAVARAYHEVGLRAVIAPMMADRTLWQALPGLMDSLPGEVRGRVEQLRTAPHEASIEVCRAILSGWPFDRAMVRPALGPTIPLHCSDGFLVACRNLAREFDVALQTHLAESRTQALLGPMRYAGRTLAAHLADLGLLGPNFSGAHGVWLDDDDIGRLADAGATVAHNPLSNLRLGSGVAPVRRMRRRGLGVGIGTDAVSTSDTQNMFEATRLASYLSRVLSVDPEDWLAAHEVLAMATAGSARVLGMDDLIGRLAPGYRADIVFLDLAHIGYVPLGDVVLQIVNGESGAAIDRVMIDGRMVLEGGRLLTVDEARVRQEAERTATRLREAAAEGLALARSVERYVEAFCVAHLRQAPAAGVGQFRAGSGT